MNPATAERASLLREDVESGGLEDGTSATDSDMPGEECRICRCGSGALVRTCRCASVVHMSCLKAWLSARAANTFPALRASSLHECEVCGSSCAPWAGGGRLRPLVEMLARVSAALHSLEGCATVLLLALAVCGHGLFLCAVLRGPTYHGSRAVLAVANAAATAALLVIAVRALAKWVRDRRFAAVVAVAGLPGAADGEGGSEAQQQPAPGFAGQVVLGATLSVVATMQVFLLLSAG